MLGAGAHAVIVSSSLFRDGAVDVDFARTLADAIGPERVIAAVDSRGGHVAIHGWKTVLPITAVEAVRALEPYCGEFLYTHVDTEGLMQGTDMDAILAVRARHDAGASPPPAASRRGTRSTASTPTASTPSSAWRSTPGQLPLDAGSWYRSYVADSSYATCQLLPDRYVNQRNGYVVQRNGVMDNPFVYGEIVPREAFADREAELDRLVADLTAAQKVFLISPRRYGKSSLVRQALGDAVAPGRADGRGHGQQLQLVRVVSRGLRAGTGVGRDDGGSARERG